MEEREGVSAEGEKEKEKKKKEAKKSTGREVVEQILKKSLTEISQDDIVKLDKNADFIKSDPALKSRYYEIVRRLLGQEDKNWVRRVLSAIGKAENLQPLLLDDIKGKVSKVIERQESKEDIDRINRILENPLHFTLAGVRFLEQEKIFELLDDKQKVRFCDLIVYHIESAKSAGRFSELIPPRILIEVKSSSKLWSVLPWNLKADIDKKVEEERNMVLKIIKDKGPEQWNKAEVSRICALYRQFQAGGFSGTERISQGLAKWVGNIFVKLRAERTDRPKIQEISSTHKLLILEIRKLFEDSKFALRGEVVSEFGKLAGEVAESLIGGDNDPSLLLMWDLIEDMPESDLPSGFDKAKLNELVEYGNASQFLFTIEKRGEGVLSRMEFEALEEVYSAIWKPPKFYKDNFERGLRRKPLDEEWTKAQKELRRLEIHIEDDEACKEAARTVWRSNETSLEAFETADDRKQDCFKDLEDLFASNIEELQKEEAFSDLQSKLDEYRALEGKDETQMKYITEFISGLTTKELAKRFEGKDPLEQSKWEKRAQEMVGDLIKKKEEHEKAEKAWKAEKEKVKEAWDKYNRIDELRKKVKKNSVQYDAEALEEKLVYGMLEYFDGTKQQEVAEEVRKKYFEGLESRVQSHKLYADDLDILWQEGEVGRREDEWASGEVDKEESPYAEVSEDREKDWLEEIREGAKGKLAISFRKSFEEVLFGKGGADVGLIEKIQFPSNDPEEMLQVVQKHLGFIPLLDEFKKLLNWDELVTNPQIKHEIIKATLHHFRDRIFEAIGERLPKDMKEAEKTKFWNEVRRHFAVRTPFHNQNIREKYQSYDQQQADMEEILELGREKYDEVMKDVTDEEKKSEVEDSFRVWTNDIEGFDTLVNNLNLQTTKEQEKIKGILNALGTRQANLVEELKKGKKDNALAFFDALKAGAKEIDSIIGDIERACRDLGFSEESIDKFIEQFFQKKVRDEILGDIDRSIETLRDLHKNGTLDGTENVWKDLESHFSTLRSHLDFDNQGSELRKASVAQHEDFKKQPDNINALKSLGFFDENGEDKAAEEFDKLRRKYNQKFAEYDRNVKDITRKISSDIKKLDDDKFMEKYNGSKEYMLGLLDQYEQGRVSFEKVWEDFGKPDFFQNWIDEYHGRDPEIEKIIDPAEKADRIARSRVKAIDKFSDWEEIKNSVEEMGKYSKDYKEWLDSYSEFTRKSKKLNIKVQWFSLRSIYGMGKVILEGIEKRRKRREDRAVGNIGIMVFGKTTAMGKEFMRIAQSSEKERIEEWKTAYGNEEGWAIRKHLYESNDPDEVRACMDLLLDKGFLMWDDPKLWKVFNKLQSNVEFRIPKDKELSDKDFKEKMRIACRAIWPLSGDVFREWEGGFESGMKKAQEAHTKEFSDLETTGGREQVLATMLQKWKRGKTEGVDPSRFEAFIRQAFEQGKMNGQPDPRWYYLIMGLSVENPSGQTILSRNILARFQDLISRIPQVEFLIDKDAYKKDGEIVPEGTQGAKVRPWNNSDFKAWNRMLGGDTGTDFNIKRPGAEIGDRTTEFFYQVITPTESALGRAGRTEAAAKGNADHDDGAMFSAAWDFETVNRQLVLEMNQSVKFTDDFWRNVLRGYDLYFRQRYDYINKKDKVWKDNPKWLEQKDKLLLELGDRLKASFAVTQSLAGNYWKTGKSTTFFDQGKWEKESGMSPSAEKSKAKINDFMGRMLEDAEEMEHSYLFKMRTNRDAISDGEGKKITEKTALLFEKNNVFRNTERIERVLGNYVKETGGVMCSQMDILSNDSMNKIGLRAATTDAFDFRSMAGEVANEEEGGEVEMAA